MATTTKGRLNIAIDEEAIDTLRSLAGGERKIGTFLAGAARFLGSHAELIKTHEWNQLAIVTALAEDALYRELVRKQVELDARLAELDKRQQGLEGVSTPTA